MSQRRTCYVVKTNPSCSSRPLTHLFTFKRWRLIHRCQANLKHAGFVLILQPSQSPLGLNKGLCHHGPFHLSFFNLTLLSPVSASSRKGQAEWKRRCHRLYALKTSRGNETTASSFRYAWAMSCLWLCAQLHWSRLAVRVSSLFGLGKLCLMNLLQGH